MLIFQFYLQIATGPGAITIVTSSSKKRLETVRKLGGTTHGINYRTDPVWEEEVLRLTDGKVIDYGVEIGGAQSMEKSVRATEH